jgi:pectin lyase
VKYRRRANCVLYLLANNNNHSHNFDVEAGAKILLEGNVFKDCKAPVSAATLKLTSGLFNVPTTADAASCSVSLGRACEINSLSGSGDFGSFADTAAVEAVGKADSVWRATSADDATALKTSAGVGKLDSEASGGSDAGAEVKMASPASSTSVSSLTTIVVSTTTTKAPAATSSTASTTAARLTANSVAVVPKWGRCGGNGWTGATSCKGKSSCTVVNDCEYSCF